MGRNELFAFSSANMLSPEISSSSRGSARKSPRMLGKTRCMRSNSCKAESPSVSHHPTCSRPRHSSHSKACSCESFAQFSYRKRVPVLLNVEPFIVSTHLVERIYCWPKLFVGHDWTEWCHFLWCVQSIMPKCRFKNRAYSLICFGKVASPSLFLSHVVLLIRRAWRCR